MLVQRCVPFARAQRALASNDAADYSWSQQLELLESWGCREAQGFHFAKPLAIEDLTPLLTRGRIFGADAVSARTAARCQQVRAQATGCLRMANAADVAVPSPLASGAKQT